MLGIDVTPVALDVARARGALVLERSVFDRVPGAGRWGTALLLDGNIGIGADPAVLLRRVAALLRPAGRRSSSSTRPARARRDQRVRFEVDGRGRAVVPLGARRRRTARRHVADDARLASPNGGDTSGRWFAWLVGRER